MNSILKKMQGGKSVLGPFVTSVSTETIEVLGINGFDFCVIDGEHGPGTYISLQNMVTAGNIKYIDMSIIYRVPENSNYAIGHALDVGADGVLVPHVDDAEAARRAVEAARFYPLGERGMNGLVKAARYGAEKIDSYIKKSNDEIMLMLQIEGLKGLKNLEEIIKVKGFNGIFIGPYDLSQSLGIPGQVKNKIVEDKIQEIIDIVKYINKELYIGIFVTDLDSAKYWMGKGVQFISYMTDLTILSGACTSILKEWNNINKAV